eukprot:CAMPEP_0197185198 /NCGR_PEP_ID=MMETSP1423-20130617/11413_1 /TAXON_ID=476441 /ORGANISM="Pseudo-nitzschia heimii, Strain UNC1101" /LENGTH=304 /DNA_ID=CAMNT_0042636199 /DNA_START=147 /DNA_END=1061 /DNA_ORIENTATION=+
MTMMMFDPTTIATAVTEEVVPDTGKILQSGLIALTLGGGLIPALLSANTAMFKALSGRKGYIPEGEEPGPEVETFENYDPNNTFDPTMGDAKNIKYREYVIDSGATGPELPSKQFLFAADAIPIADIVAVLGRIEDKDSLANWRALPSATRGAVTPGQDPPMWLPRKAFKVQIRKNRFLGWPNDPKTGLPVGGEDLKRTEEKRIAKKDALIGDAALDAVFDSWAGGASVATPDKVESTLRKIKPIPGTNEVDLNAFVGAAIQGRANTAFASLTFIVIQIFSIGSLFINPLIKSLTGVDVFSGFL